MLERDLKMDNLKKADWTEYQFALANYELNKSYFDSGKYKTLTPYYKLKEAIQFVTSSSGRDLSILDIGCGAGWYAKYLKEECEIKNYTGMDISKHMCDFANIACPDFKFVVGDILSNNDLEKYDLVMEGAAIEEVFEWKIFLKKMINYSKKWLIFHRLFFIENNSKIDQVKTYNDVPDIRNYVNLREMKEILNQNDFIPAKEDVWTEGHGTFVFIKK